MFWSLTYIFDDICCDKSKKPNVILHHIIDRFVDFVLGM